MTIRVRNPETEKLIRELAQLRGQSITEVLTDLMRRELEREDRKSSLRPSIRGDREGGARIGPVTAISTNCDAKG